MVSPSASLLSCALGEATDKRRSRTSSTTTSRSSTREGEGLSTTHATSPSQRTGNSTLPSSLPHRRPRPRQQTQLDQEHAAATPLTAPAHAAPRLSPRAIATSALQTPGPSFLPAALFVSSANPHMYA